MAKQGSAFRIIGGRWRGRQVRYAAAAGLRVSGDRLRESLFNCLGGDLHGLLCLDLFAGAGALGLEAASRGARVVCVERRQQTLLSLRRAATTLAADNVEICGGSAAGFLARCRQQFDLIFLDPPFADYAADAAWHKLLHKLPLAADGEAYCESDRHWPPPPPFRILRQKRSGAVCWQLVTRT